MAQPTTRLGRFHERRKRYLRRRANEYRRGWDWTHNVFGHGIRGPRVETLGTGPVQGLGLVPDVLPLHGPHGPGGNPFIGWGLVRKPERGYPPIPKILTIFGFPYVEGTNHARSWWIGYHTRKVHARRHKPERHDGAWRREWGARAFCWNNGYWPDWDPLARHPVLADITSPFDLIFWPSFPAPGEGV